LKLKDENKKHDCVFVITMASAERVRQFVLNQMLVGISDSPMHCFVKLLI